MPGCAAIQSARSLGEICCPPSNVSVSGEMQPLHRIGQPCTQTTARVPGPSTVDPLDRLWTYTISLTRASGHLPTARRSIATRLPPGCTTHRHTPASGAYCRIDEGRQQVVTLSRGASRRMRKRTFVGLQSRRTLARNIGPQVLNVV